jgi:hypothetical protein
LAFFPGVAQGSAEERSVGAWLSLGRGLELSSGGRELLSAGGGSLSVEAGLSIPGGTAHYYVLGLRGVALELGPGQLGARGFSATALGMLRLELLRAPLVHTMPYFIGGLELGLGRDAGATRLSPRFGPRFGVGLELELGQARYLLLDASGGAGIDPPLRVQAELRLTLLVE